MTIVRSAILVAVAAGTFGCNTLDRYSTAPGESYCGSITSNATFRTGFARSARMRVTLDAVLFDSAVSPGSVWTYELPDGATPGRRLVEGMPLRAIPQLENDPLAMPDLGAGRDHTRVFALSASAPEEDALLAVVSLRSDEGVEVRLLRPGVAALRPGRGPLFGLFTLGKQAGTCGF